MIGYGSYHYKYGSGREGDWFLTGFAPRKRDLTIYVILELSSHKSSLKKLGQFKTGVGCLYIKKLDDIDIAVLRKILEHSLKQSAKLSG